MSSPANQACGNCQYYLANPDPSDPQSSGRCRVTWPTSALYGPQLQPSAMPGQFGHITGHPSQSNPHFVSMWTKVQPNEWCSYWQQNIP